jgi:hypothetical protein
VRKTYYEFPRCFEPRWVPLGEGKLVAAQVFEPFAIHRPWTSPFATHQPDPGQFSITDLNSLGTLGYWVGGMESAKAFVINIIDGYDIKPGDDLSLNTGLKREVLHLRKIERLLESPEVTGDVENEMLSYWTMRLCTNW